MKPLNVAIIILFILVLILIYQLYNKRKKKGFTTIYTPLDLNDLQKIITDNANSKSKQEISINNIDYDNLQRIIKLDINQKEITVEAGCSIKDICKYLEEYNLALASVPFDINQPIAKACSLAAHGSDLNTGTMSDQVVDLTIVLANGHLRRIEFNDPEFPAFATSLGTLGLPYSITLQCTDYYVLEKQHFTDQWDNLQQNLDNLLNKCSILTIFVRPNKQVDINCYSKTINPSGDYTLYYDIKPLKDNNTSTKLHVAVPINKFIPAIDKVITDHLENDLCISFTGADYNSWLSPASGRTSAWISTSFESLITAQECENALIDSYDARPDWNNMLNSDKIKKLYGMSLDYVTKVKNTFDPHKVFSDFNNIFE